MGKCYIAQEEEHDLVIFSGAWGGGWSCIVLWEVEDG